MEIDDASGDVYNFLLCLNYSRVESDERNKRTRVWRKKCACERRVYIYLRVRRNAESGEPRHVESGRAQTVEIYFKHCHTSQADAATSFCESLIFLSLRALVLTI